VQDLDGHEHDTQRNRSFHRCLRNPDPAQRRGRQGQAVGQREGGDRTDQTGQLPTRNSNASTNSK
jgi:hypothetical protein